MASNKSTEEVVATPYAKQRNLKEIKMEELRKHNSESSCWMAIHGIVYDLTPFLNDHPGGTEVLLNASGNDATDEFEDIGHSSDARDLAKQFEIGVLENFKETATGCNRPIGLQNEQKAAGGLQIMPILMILLLAVVAYFIFINEDEVGVESGPGAIEGSEDTIGIS